MMDNGMMQQDIEVQREMDDRCPKCGSPDTTYADYLWTGEDELPYGTVCIECGHDTVFGPRKPFLQPGSEGSWDRWEDFSHD